MKTQHSNANCGLERRRRRRKLNNMSLRVVKQLQHPSPNGILYIYIYYGISPDINAVNYTREHENSCIGHLQRGCMPLCQ